MQSTNPKLTFSLVYIFDMRKMTRALNVLKDHVAAVMDVEFSPTGEELVSASYDRTVRLWSRMKGHSSKQLLIFSPVPKHSEALLPSCTTKKICFQLDCFHRSPQGS